MCALATLALAARENGRTIAEVGTTTARPPYHPVALGALAGPHHEPVKVTSIHQRHVALGAQWMDTGEWKRPRVYTSGADEVRGVRERVGLIDVGTLGKLDVRGKDAVKLLEKVYTNRVADLRIGRIRYGVMCDDSGIILDDGTIARLSDDHFFLTTTSTGANAIEEWLTWWAAGTGMCVHVTNVTDGYAAINLAGPRAREVLAKLTTQDLSSKALPFLAARQFDVAGIPTLCLRIGFVGELGYELHCPAESGAHLWDALLDAGKEHGIVPFGVEAQRVLRLEKGHIIVTQDTDALSNPLEADMAWVVKLDKDDFVGRPMLQRVQAERLRNKLVGYEMVESSIVPEEGSQVVVAGRPAGRVSSSRFSPTLQKSIGMAWVPIDYASLGTLFSIRWNERDVSARVVRLPFYDPEGARLKGGDWSPPSAGRSESWPTPTKLSAFHDRLRGRGATPVDVDGWQQAERIANVEDEARRSRDGIGVVDVSPSGKLDLKGVDVAALLARLGGDGITVPGLLQNARIDIGGDRVVVVRLAEDHTLVITPAAARGRVAEAIAGAISGGDGCHHLTDVTSTLAGLRLVGPRSCDVLRMVTSADLRDRVVPNETCAQVGLARIPALIVRRDVAGLPSYEVYVARSYGEYAWDVLFEAGREFGITPLGLAAWRMLSEEA
jgi:sarcosine oxidase subunit alpha